MAKWLKKKWIIPDFCSPPSLCPSLPPSSRLHPAKHAKLPSAIRAAMYCVLHGINAEWNQTTPGPTADQNQPSTSQPSQCSRGISDGRDYCGSAERTNHRHGCFTIHRIPNNNGSRRLLNNSCCGGVCTMRPNRRRWPIPLWWGITWLHRWVALLKWRVSRWSRISGLAGRWITRLAVRRWLVRHLGSDSSVVWLVAVKGFPRKIYNR